jgi:formylglycine-generating enzyme required for sulfatase activity
MALVGLALALLAGCQQVLPESGGGAPPVVTTPSGVAMVRLPGGWFVMGSGARGQTDEPPHRVFVSPFDIDACEVTQAEFEKVTGGNPSRWKNERNPVEQIRWADAARYCGARSRLEGLRPAYDEKTWACDFAAGGYRLPTEAEWEYACRAGAQTEFCSGNSPGGLAEHAWFKDNGGRGPHPVAEKKPNAWGLFDMHGNVWEWCNDFYDEASYKSGPDRDPAGPPSGKSRALRGGCWNSRADLCRAAYRNEEDPGYTDTCFGRDIHGFVGFRCVRRPGHGAPGRTQS